jgi:hypothetical protein
MLNSNLLSDIKNIDPARRYDHLSTTVNNKFLTSFFFIQSIIFLKLASKFGQKKPMYNENFIGNSNLLSDLKNNARSRSYRVGGGRWR